MYKHKEMVETIRPGRIRFYPIGFRTLFQKSPTWPKTNHSYTQDQVETQESHAILATIPSHEQISIRGDSDYLHIASTHT